MSFDMFPPSDVPDPVSPPDPVVRFGSTVEWAAGQLGEAERFENAGKPAIASAYRKQAVAALDAYFQGLKLAEDAHKCSHGDGCDEPTLFDQEELAGLVVDDFDGAWARIKAWLGFGGAR